jgi:hypothetical protein
MIDRRLFFQQNLAGNVDSGVILSSVASFQPTSRERSLVSPTAQSYMTGRNRFSSRTFVVLGGLFPVHEKSEVAGQPCSTQLYDRWAVVFSNRS